MSHHPRRRRAHRRRHSHDRHEGHRSEAARELHDAFHCWHQRRFERHTRAHAGDGYDACGGRASGSRRRRRHARKERVLHTRISEDLAEDIRRLADELRLPVSNLVRNVLEETFSVVEAMSDDVGDLFDDVLGEAEAARERMRRRRARRAGAPSDVDDARHRRAADDPDDAGAPTRSAAAEVDASDPAEASDRTDRASGADRAEGFARERATPEVNDADRFEHVLAWQPLVSNRAAICAACSASLERGERVLVSIGESGLGFDTVLCSSCSPELKR